MDIYIEVFMVQFAGSAGPFLISYTLHVFNGIKFGLSPIGQPPEENCYDYFYAYKAAIRIKAGYG